MSHSSISIGYSSSSFCAWRMLFAVNTISIPIPLQLTVSSSFSTRSLSSSTIRILIPIGKPPIYFFCFSSFSYRKKPADRLLFFCQLACLKTIITCLFFSVKAIGTHFAFRQSDRLYQIVQTVIPEAGEILTAADFLAHGLVAVAGRICILFQYFLCIFSLFFQNNPSGDQIQLGFGAGEIQEFAAVQQRRARRADMNFFCTALI